MEDLQREELLRIEHLSVTFTQYDGWFSRKTLPVIRDLSLRVSRGEMVAVVGSSGSGKSLLAHAVMGVLPYNGSCGGDIYYKGKQLTTKRIKQLRGNKIVLVPQSVSYLDPLMKVGEQVAGGKDRISLEKSRKALTRYGLDKEVDNMYPFELSGGMARRVLIGTAVVEKPELVIADEPTPGLHMEAAVRVLSHFREIADEGAGVLLITHDLELALKTADRIVVFYAGTAVEEAACVDFDQELRHPYTRALFRAMPEHGFAPEPGIQPYVRDLPERCPYGPRCPKYREECSKEISYVSYQGGLVRCICPGDEKEILPGILSESEVLKEKMTSEPSSGECSVCGKEGAGL
jgi:peptide/nickel transport system ATP-binding protein